MCANHKNSLFWIIYLIFVVVRRVVQQWWLPMKKVFDYAVATLTFSSFNSLTPIGQRSFFSKKCLNLLILAQEAKMKKNEK
jgi:hypothetical protein